MTDNKHFLQIVSTESTKLPELNPVEVFEPETTSRMESMADELQMSLAKLIELAERHGLEIIATRARKPAKAPGHC